MVVVGGLLALWCGLALIDLRRRIVPNVILFPAMLLTLAAAPWLPMGDGQPTSAYLGSLAGGATCFLAAIAAAIASRGGLKPGDMKLSLQMGLALGPSGGLIALAMACVVACPLVLVATRLHKGDRWLPFVPFMAAGAMAVLLAGDTLRGWLNLA